MRFASATCSVKIWPVIRAMTQSTTWVATVRGAYGTAEAGTRAQYVQYAGPWVQAALRLRYVPDAGGWYA